MNRSDLQRLSSIRVKEAKLLLDNDYYDGAYYLTGYAVECALKACIARRTRRYDFPDKRSVMDSYVHDLEKLVRTAGLQGDLAVKSQTNPRFATNWSIVKEWNEDSRYGDWAKPDAEGLYNAVTERLYGVLRWVKLHW
jgi:HEPN domain-containing protein